MLAERLDQLELGAARLVLDPRRRASELQLHARRRRRDPASPPANVSEIPDARTMSLAISAVSR
jgi:hypothetical protein